MKSNEILRWLKTEDFSELKKLWSLADEARAQNVGDEIYLRGLIEIGNICARQCAYCGLRADNRKLSRYRMSVEEILQCARLAVEFGYGTVVLQSGEDNGFSTGMILEIIRRIKSETNLAITLSVGERSEKELAQWREAGADRYLLRFETSNKELFEKIHPSLIQKKSDRIKMLWALKKLGYEVGSGFMIGIPGQTWNDLLNDILLLRELDLDMIGIGPFIPHPETPLGKNKILFDDQVPSTELMTYKVFALARLVCPKANIPSTTALATLNPARGHELALSRGANVIMPNITPAHYRERYQLYPNKAFADAISVESRRVLKDRIHSIGRKIGVGQGTSPHFKNYEYNYKT